MISVALAGKWLELSGGTYEHRATIMQLADYPDVQWDATRKIWRIDARLFAKLADHLANHLAPMDADTLMRLPVGERAMRKARRSKKQALADKAETRRRAPDAVRMVEEMGGD